MTEPRKQPHAVVFPYPGQGHINPLVQLSLTLASSLGFYVTFVSTQRNHKSMVEAWARRGLSLPESRGISMHIVTIPDDMLPERNMKDIPKFIRATREMKEPFVALVQRIVQDSSCPAMTCIVSDSILGWVQDVASMFNVPWIAFYPLPVSTFLAEQSVPLLLAAGKIPVQQDTVKADDVLSIPGLPSIHPTDLPDFVQNNYNSDIDTECRNSIHSNQRLKNASWIIVNSCDILEGGEIAAAREQGFPQLVPVGPLLPATFLEDEPKSSDMGITGALWGEEESCMAWLDMHPPLSVLYVSFGSVSNISALEMENLLEGLINSNEAFLWVLRPNLIMGMSEEAWQDYVERANKHGLIVRWAPQLKVLRHPSVRAFLTHCGWNSTLESICAAVPMICWPCFFEQRMNCKYIVDVWKVGTRISRDQVEKAVTEMMRGGASNEMRKRICELRNGCKLSFMDKSNLRTCVSRFSL